MQLTSLSFVKSRIGRNVGSFVVVLAGSLMALSATAQPFSPYSVFEEMDLEDLETLQVKLTFVGVQSKAIPSLLFTEASNELDIEFFVPFQRPGISYFNDTVVPRSFKVSAVELEQLIDNVSTLPEVTKGEVAENVNLSFAMHNTIGGGVGFEAIVDFDTTQALFAEIREALAASAPAMLEINALGCSIDAMEEGEPADVSASVTTALSGVRLKRDQDVFVGQLSVENSSGVAIQGPVSVVFGLPSTIRLATFDGYTCKFAPAGRRYLDLPLDGGSLGNGESVEMTVEFSNPDLDELSATLQVLSGPGAR